MKTGDRIYTFTQKVATLHEAMYYDEKVTIVLKDDKNCLLTAKTMLARVSENDLQCIQRTLMWTEEE